MSIDRREFTKLALALAVAKALPGTQPCNAAEQIPNVLRKDAPVEAAMRFLREQMDQFHSSFVIYDDRDSGAIHFHPSGFMGDFERLAEPDAKKVVVDNCTDQPAVGVTLMRITYPADVARRGGEGWAGVYLQFPDKNWGEFPGYDLRRYCRPDEPVQLELLVRLKEGDSLGELKAGGIGQNSPVDHPHKDSFGPLLPTTIKADPIHKGWTRVIWNLTGEDLQSVLGGFCWVTNRRQNPRGCVIDIDQAMIRFGAAGTKARLAEPHFVRSYFPPLPAAPDRYFRNACYLYDQALLLLVFLMQGAPDDHERGRVLADAMVFAQEHDREFNDGRLRNAYACGDLDGGPRAKSKTAKTTTAARLPGWWDDADSKWYEDTYFAGSDSGNLAWAAISLMHYWRLCDHKADSKYLRAVRRLGNWLYDNGFDKAGGYTGGLAFDSKAKKLIPVRWKSVEHNLDLACCFTLLHDAGVEFPADSGEPDWKMRSEHAQRFCDSMWDSKDGHFWTGTDEAGSINMKPIPVDAQAWGVLALRDRKYVPGLNWAESNCKVAIKGQVNAYGFDFDTSLDGVWYEGTAQMAVAYALAGSLIGNNEYVAKTRACQTTLRSAAQDQAMHGGIPASDKDGLTTGFDKEWGQWVYYHRPHVGATAWFLFALRDEPWNPYWAESVRKK